MACLRLEKKLCVNNFKMNVIFVFFAFFLLVEEVYSKYVACRPFHNTIVKECGKNEDEVSLSDD